MEPIYIILIAVLGFILFSVGFYLFTVVFASYQVYVQTLSRRSPQQWSREVPPDNELQLIMDGIGMKWREEHLEFKYDVHIVNEGYNLYGEYYDLGYDKSVIILSGRTESLRYGFYFCFPYVESGFNLLVVDPRAHGKSDGKYNTLGFNESKDALAWAAHLHENFGVKDIIFHGICIGAAGGMYASTSENCPDYIKGLVTEGMFINFAESMKNHLIERKKLMFPIMQSIDMWMKKYTGYSMKKGPIDVIDRMQKPLLMLQSKEDNYSTPQNAQLLFDKCGSANKRLVYFEKGAHSMLRITDTEKYDKSIKDFINELYS